MLSSSRLRHPDRCTVCGGNFGLIRYYSWRNTACSKKCSWRLRDRRENHSRWLVPAIPITSQTDLLSEPVDRFEPYQGMSLLNS
jgi:hypothetical protein